MDAFKILCSMENVLYEIYFKKRIKVMRKHQRLTNIEQTV